MFTLKNVLKCPKVCLYGMLFTKVIIEVLVSPKPDLKRCLTRYSVFGGHDFTVNKSCEIQKPLLMWHHLSGHPTLGYPQLDVQLDWSGHN